MTFIYKSEWEKKNNFKHLKITILNKLQLSIINTRRRQMNKRAPQKAN